MSNTILTPNIIANEALDVLRTNAVMANLVHRDYSSEFVAGVGDTITVRKPATFEAKEFTTEVEVQDATEGKVPVKMDKLLDVTFAVTSKELTMGIVDFSAQFLVPAMQAFADKIDGYLLALEKDVTNRVDHTKGAIAVADIIAARKFLVDAKAPSTERRFVYGSQAEADLLNTEAFTNASAVGDNGTALKEASAWPQVWPRLLLRPERSEDDRRDGQLHALNRVPQERLRARDPPARDAARRAQGLLHLLRRLRPARSPGLRPEDQDRHRLHRHALRRQDPQPRARRSHHR